MALCARGKNFFKLSFMAFSYSLDPLLYRIPNVSTSLRTNKKGVKPLSECLPLFKYFKNGLIKICDFKAKSSNKANKNKTSVLRFWDWMKSFWDSQNTVKFRKGPFWGAYFWRGLYSERLIYGKKFVLQNRLG